jgi:integrase
VIIRFITCDRGRGYALRRKSAALTRVRNCSGVSGSVGAGAGFTAARATLIAAAGDAAGWRYVEFFTANIRNPNTRRAYARACGRFFAWCDDRGLTLATIRPHDVATYIEERQATHSAPDVKQQLAAVRMMFDWLIVGQVAPSNPASAVRGPKHVVKTGKTPVLEGKEWRRLIDTIPTNTARDLRDRALIATLTYGFARVGAALKMRVEDLQSKGSGWLIRLHEKGGKQHMMPCHHASPRRCTPTSPAPTLRRTRKGFCSAPRAAMTARCCRISR